MDAALAQSSSDESEGDEEVEAVQEVEQEVVQSIAPTQLTPATITAGADRWAGVINRFREGRGRACN